MWRAASVGHTWLWGVPSVWRGAGVGWNVSMWGVHVVWRSTQFGGAQRGVVPRTGVLQGSDLALGFLCNMGC